MELRQLRASVRYNHLVAAEHRVLWLSTFFPMHTHEQCPVGDLAHPDIQPPDLIAHRPPELAPDTNSMRCNSQYPMPTANLLDINSTWTAF